jgi:hypothetical protein
MCHAIDATSCAGDGKRFIHAAVEAGNLHGQTLKPPACQDYATASIPTFK